MLNSIRKRTPPKRAIVILAVFISANFACLGLLRQAGGNPALKISAVRGEVANGRTIIISGQGFGPTGPRIAVFDDFEKGADGTLISNAADSAAVNQWTDTRGKVTYSTEYAHSGAKSSRHYQALSGANHLHLEFNPKATEVFQSFWAFVPEDRDVPGKNNADGPNWKMSWLYSGDSGQSGMGSDYVSCAIIGPIPRDSFIWGGHNNDTKRSVGSYVPTSFRKGRWIRWDFYVKGNTTDTSENGIMSLGELTPTGYRQIGTVKKAYTLVRSRDAGWGILHIPGYARQDANGVIHHDDIYVATGPGSRARAELGNSSTYGRCTNLSICTINNWSNSQISATVRSGSFRAGPAYIFVIDADGNISSGFPIEIQAGE